MAEVIHTIKGNEYLYEHTREGEKVVCEYIGPVGKGGKVRKAQHGGGAPLKVTQQTGIQKNEENIIKGKAINNKKDNNRLEDKTSTERKSTMGKIDEIDKTGYTGLAEAQIQSLNRMIKTHNKHVDRIGTDGWEDITIDSIAKERLEIDTKRMKVQKEMEEQKARKADINPTITKINVLEKEYTKIQTDKIEHQYTKVKNDEEKKTKRQKQAQYTMQLDKINTELRELEALK